MKDIDFDELDKAVNSLMASTTAQTDNGAAANPEQTGATLTPTSAAPAETVPVVAQPSAPVAGTPAPQVNVVSEQTVSPVAAPAAPATTVQAQPPERPAAPAVRRSTGRFMDMVSKPSDTRSPQPVTPAPTASAAPPSREGLTITPRSQPDTAAPEQPSAPTTSDVAPDPIDTYQQQTESVSAEPTVEQIAPVQPTQPSAPIESPFLSDAKVEKRPLNAGSNDIGMSPGDALQEDALPQEETEPQSESSGNGNDEPPVNPQVAELDSNLVAIEATENKESEVATEAPQNIERSETPAMPLGPSSIPQQYATQPSSGDHSHAAIYDASQYPETISHPAKTKSGWLWVLWVILLLSVGAGGAVALYNLGIIP